MQKSDSQFLPKTSKRKMMIMPKNAPPKIPPKPIIPVTYTQNIDE